MLTAEQEIAAALERGDAGAVRYWQHVIEVVDAAPPFTPALIAQLQVLVRTDPATPAPTPIRRRASPRSEKTRTAALTKAAAA